MKRLAVLLVLLLLPSLAGAATYYFSDCATGGTGTSGDPFCLDQANDGTKESVMLLFDGVNSGANKEAVAGDTINLCCGACDGGTRSCTYHVNCMGVESITSSAGADGTYWFSPRVAASSGSPITIQAYTGATPTITGDLNDNATFDGSPLTCTTTTDIQHLITDRTAYGSVGKNGYTWTGISFKRAGDKFFILDQGEKDWTINGGTWSESGLAVWNVSPGVATMGCGLGSQNYGFYVHNVAAGGAFTLENATIHTTCGITLRMVNNTNAGSTLVITGNTIYDTPSIGNWFECDGVTISGNTFYDFDQGPALEEKMRNVTLTNNDISCRGLYQASANRRCSVGIVADNGDNGAANGGQSHDISITKNKVYAYGVGAVNDAHFQTGILFESTCFDNSICTGAGTPVSCCPSSCPCQGASANFLISGNMVWNIQSEFSGPASQAGRGQGIDVRSATAVGVKYNTVYQATYPLNLDSSPSADVGAGNTVVHSVIANLLAYSPSGIVLSASSAAAGSTVNANDAWTSGTGTVTNAGSAQDCATLNSSGVIGTGTSSGNACVVPTFWYVTDPSPAFWNLRMSPYDQATYAVGGSTCSGLTDFDGQIRPDAATGACDIGADEFYGIHYLCVGCSQGGACCWPPAGGGGAPGVCSNCGHPGID